MLGGSSTEFRYNMRLTNAIAGIYSFFAEAKFEVFDEVSNPATIPIVTAQAIVNAYSFFSNLGREHSLNSEQLVRASVSLICGAQLGLAIYFLFTDRTCEQNTSSKCKAYLLLSGLKLALTLISFGVGEAIKRPYEEEQAARAARTRARANSQTFFDLEAQQPPMQTQFEFAGRQAPIPIQFAFNGQQAPIQTDFAPIIFTPNRP